MAMILAACVLAPLLAAPTAARVGAQHGPEAMILGSCGVSLLTAMVFGAATSGACGCMGVVRELCVSCVCVCVFAKLIKSCERQWRRPRS